MTSLSQKANQNDYIYPTNVYRYLHDSMIPHIWISDEGSFFSVVDTELSSGEYTYSGDLHKSMSWSKISTDGNKIIISDENTCDAPKIFQKQEHQEKVVVMPQGYNNSNNFIQELLEMNYIVAINFDTPKAKMKDKYNFELTRSRIINNYEVANRPFFLINKIN